MKLVVTIPAQNEAPTIGQVVADIPRRIPGVEVVEVLVVDDGSTDETADLARAAGAKVISVTGRPGLGPIWRLGMDRAIRSGADLIVNIDGDGQFDSRDVARIVHPLLAGECDFVTCTRFAGDGPVGYMPPIKRWGNRIVTRMINLICGTNFSDVSCGFRAYNREAAYRLAQFGRWTYTEECIVYLVNRGLRLKEMPFRVLGEREHGQSRVAHNVIYFAINLLHILLRAVRDGRPMAFFGSIAAVLAVPGIVSTAFISTWWVINGTTQPWTSLVSVSGLLMVLAFVVAMLALLADMLSRHRRLNEELLYLARQRVYATRSATTALDVTPVDAGRVRSLTESPALVASALGFDEPVEASRSLAVAR